jgi:hypothetical protein
MVETSARAAVAVTLRVTEHICEAFGQALVMGLHENVHAEMSTFFHGQPSVKAAEQEASEARAP